MCAFDCAIRFKQTKFMRNYVGSTLSGKAAIEVLKFVNFFSRILEIF